MDVCKKKEKKVEPRSAKRNEEGDAWTYTCVKRISYFFVGFSVGKLTSQTCRELLFDLAVRLGMIPKGNKVEFFTDGNEDYTNILPDYFPTYKMNYGQLVKTRKGNKLVHKRKRVVYGNPSIDEIETTDVENYNSIFRERIGRFVRKTKCFSKLKKRLIAAIHVFAFYWNFISNIRRGISPAMIEGLIDHKLTWEWFLHKQLSKTN